MHRARLNSIHLLSSCQYPALRLQTTSLGSARDLTFSLERVFFADGRYSAWTKNAVGQKWAGHFSAAQMIGVIL